MKMRIVRRTLIVLIIIYLLYAFMTLPAEAKAIHGKVRRPDGAFVWDENNRFIGDEFPYGTHVKFTGQCDQGTWGKYAEIYYKNSTAWIWWWHATNSPCQPNPPHTEEPPCIGRLCD